MTMPTTRLCRMVHIGRRKSLSSRRRDRIARGSLRVRCIRSKRLFIVSYNEVVIILFPRGGANTDGGPIIPVIILIGALTSTIIISVEIQHTGERKKQQTGERRRETERQRKRERARVVQFQPRSDSVIPSYV